MKSFNGGAELRLGREDLQKILGKWFNENFASFAVADQEVTQMSLHPANKYVARLTVRPMARDRSQE